MANKRFFVAQQQAGVVLFLALMALVVMSLAAAALIRNVDTNAQIAGNLAFKQSARLAADRGVEAAFNWLGSNTLAYLETRHSTQGYWATIPDLQAPVDPTKVYLDNPPLSGSISPWNDSVRLPDAGDGNTVDYFIERMCLREEASNKAPAHCLFGANPENPSVDDQAGVYGRSADPKNQPSPIFRVTVRVLGPKNTASYTQAYAY